jgi:lysophospholipase L1-like esterase
LIGEHWTFEFCSLRALKLATHHASSAFNSADLLRSLGEHTVRTGTTFLGWILFVLALAIPTVSGAVAAEAPAGYALQFFGNGSNQIDRVKIRLDAPARPVDVGAGDFTIEWWMKAAPGANASSMPCSAAKDSWINGNILLDRDIYGDADSGDFGVSLMNGRLAFGAANTSGGVTCCGARITGDGVWHHVAATRRANGGRLQIYVDGQLDGEINGPTGDLRYRNNRATLWPDSDPFLVIGAEKHDAGPAYPSYRGLLDELRLSSSLRYANGFVRPTAPFVPDGQTAGLYHFDEGSGTMALDVSEASGGPSDGEVRFGGDPPGPLWNADSPFAATNAPVRVMPLGDSITQGGQGFASYRYPLWFMLRNAGLNVDFVGERTTVFEGDGGSNPNTSRYPNYYTTFDRDHQGSWGWSTAEVLSVIDDVLSTTSADVVLLHLGSNDVGQEGAAGVNDATNNLDRIIVRLRAARTNVTVLLAQIIPFGPSSGYFDNEEYVPTFNQRVARLAALLDTTVSRILIVDQFTGYNPGTMFQSDDTHPNTLGEAVMATNWFNALRPVLENSVTPYLPVRLTIGRDAGNVVLNWPAATGHYVPEATTNLSPPVLWTRLTNGLVNDGTNWALTNALSGGQRFYRLRLD